MNRPIAVLLLLTATLGWVLKDHPTEAELAANPMAAPATTTTTSPAPATVTTSPVKAVSTSTTATTAEATTTTMSMGARCGEWWPTATAMGWPTDLLPILDEVMWRESRCTADATNGADHGLVQVNWSTWRPLVNDLGYTKADLYVPAINLLIGRLIYEQAVTYGYRCPWNPWSASGNYCDN